jgi:hypothetical protein
MSPRRNDTDSADKVARHGKVFTCNIQYGRMRDRKGRLQEGNDVRRRRRLRFHPNLKKPPKPSSPEAEPYPEGRVRRWISSSPLAATPKDAGREKQREKPTKESTPRQNR